MSGAEDQLQDLPHVDSCSSCMSCRLDGQLSDTPITPEYLKPSDFEPHDMHERQKLPACKECRGCTTNLTVLTSHGKKVIFGREFNDEAGASPNWLFVAPTPKSRSGKAIVKIACIPVAKPTHNIQIRPQCHSDKTLRFAQLYLAIELLAEDCGLTDIIPKVWVEEVNGIIPGVGYPIKWLGIWMDQAEGISLENLVRLGQPMMHPNDLLAIMHDKVNKTQVVQAAIFDLLTSQCDRHAQNIFISEQGGVMLIDNERSFFENKICGIDSILLPTTKKYTINVMENSWVHKFKDWGNKVPKCWANVPLLLDYRCYVKDGKIGKELNPSLQRCLRKAKSMAVEDLQLEYGFPNLETTMAYKNRSVAMLDQGFEFALTHGYPLNPNPWRYKFVQPCCKIKHTDTYRCSHDWSPDTSIPFGDAVSGGEWKREWPDHGSYQGGSIF